MKVLPEQCKKKSQPVVNFKDIIPIAKQMILLCQRPLNRYPGALALAHCQVDHDFPLRFFVTSNGEIIINPEILYVEKPYTHMEGCYSYSFRGEKKVKRFNTIKVKYFDENEQEHTETYIGLKAAIFQHENDHFNGKSIYS